MNSALTLCAASARRAVTLRIARLARSAVIGLFHVRLLHLAARLCVIARGCVFLRWSQPNFFAQKTLYAAVRFLRTGRESCSTD